MASDPHYTLTGVMGWPVAHSRSPTLHNHWIAEHGLQGAYVLLPVRPERLETALRALPVLGFSGCNLTIPHKVAALQWVDRVDTLAQRIGAINTIVVESDGSLTGRNTDGHGYIQSLLDAQAAWRADTGPVTVIGAGGAARAVIASLLDRGAREVRVVNRSWDAANALAREFGPNTRAVAWQERHDSLVDIALLVNTTSQGMIGQSALDLSLAQLPQTALVSDVIYTPTETPLLAAARAQGNTTANGLGMLINQARLAFEAWYGVLPAITPALLNKVQTTL